MYWYMIRVDTVHTVEIHENSLLAVITGEYILSARHFEYTSPMIYLSNDILISG